MHHFFVSPTVYEKHSEPPLPSKISVFSSAVPLSINLDDIFTSVTGPRSIGIIYTAVFVTQSDLLGKKTRLLPLTEPISPFPLFQFRMNDASAAHPQLNLLISFASLS